MGDVERTCTSVILQTWPYFGYHVVLRSQFATKGEAELVYVSSIIPIHLVNSSEAEGSSRHQSIGLANKIDPQLGEPVILRARLDLGAPGKLGLELFLILEKSNAAPSLHTGSSLRGGNALST